MNGYLSEIFASFEGEGDRVGMPAVFLRTAGCNLDCSFCDTGYARERSESAVLYMGRRETGIANPVSPARAAEIVAENFPHYSDIRLTGGEPLLQAAFLEETALLLRRKGLRLHLETNGTLADEMAGVGHALDSVTMDIKLPSTQDGRNLFGAHSAFLEAVTSLGASPGRGSGTAAGGAGRIMLCVKIVVTPECRDEEVEEAFRLVSRAGRPVPVFLQPEFDAGGPVVSGERMENLMEAGLHVLHDVRISLQMHKILRIQ